MNDDAMPDAVRRLANGADPYLDRHHVAAAERLTKLFERARLRQRVTMSYDPTCVGRAAGNNGPGDLADSAADARARLNRLAGLVAQDCWGVLTDVCGFDKGLQAIETERNWPRRSAKLVLRIGLDQLAAQFGMEVTARGPDKARLSAWLPERPPMFQDE